MNYRDLSYSLAFAGRSPSLFIKRYHIISCRANRAGTMMRKKPRGIRQQAAVLRAADTSVYGNIFPLNG